MAKTISDVSLRKVAIISSILILIMTTSLNTVPLLQELIMVISESMMGNVAYGKKVLHL